MFVRWCVVTLLGCLLRRLQLWKSKQTIAKWKWEKKFVPFFPAKTHRTWKILLSTMAGKGNSFIINLGMVLKQTKTVFRAINVQRAWEEFCRRDNTDTASSSTSTLFVCSDHFQPEDFRNMSCKSKGWVTIYSRWKYHFKGKIYIALIISYDKESAY